jgi:serine/threonine-protein kinase RsbT
VAQVAAPIELRLEVRGTVDVERARRAARSLSSRLGFGRFDQERLVLSVSELATNLVRYALDGCLSMRSITGASGPGVEVESRDRGPGMPDPQAVARDALTTRGGLGAGLASVRRLMDEVELNTLPSGTTIRCRKWRTHR